MTFDLQVVPARSVPVPAPGDLHVTLPPQLAQAFDAEVRRIVIWGTGSCAQQLLSALSRRMRIVAFIDNRSGAWGGALDGVRVLAPEALSGLEYDKLVIASESAAAIRGDIAALNLLDDRVLEFTGHGDGWRLGPVLEKPTFTMLQVGITSRCNLMCAHCPRDTDPGAYADVPLDTFEDYLSGFDPSQFGSLLVSDFGEVTIVKTFLAYLRRARDMGWRHVEFVTNGTNARPDLWNAIFREQLARKIYISLEGVGTAFEAVRTFPWARFAANVRAIADANEVHGNPARLVFNSVCMKSNLHDLPDVVDFAAAHRAMLTFVHLNPSNEFNNPLGRADNHLDCESRGEVLEVFAEVRRRASALGVKTMLPEEFPELDMPAVRERPHLASAHPIDRLKCQQPLAWVEVGADGGVYPCCQMAKRHPMGNLRTHTFAQIWNGPEYRRLLDGLEPGGTPIDVCRTCNIYNGKRF
jgi:radical SAM protein with 4Fe4S-binding SPASM domain